MPFDSERREEKGGCRCGNQCVSKDLLFEVIVEMQNGRSLFFILRDIMFDHGKPVADEIHRQINLAKERRAKKMAMA